VIVSHLGVAKHGERRKRRWCDQVKMGVDAAMKR
jgi:hypothetical protein